MTKRANPPHTGDSKSCQYGDKAPLKPHMSRGGGGRGLLWLVHKLRKGLITSRNQRLWECVRCRINFYTDTLNDFPSWLWISKNQPYFINHRGFNTERYFSDKVHAILIEEVRYKLRCVTAPAAAAPVSLDSQVTYLHQPSNFVLNILTLTCYVQTLF